MREEVPARGSVVLGPILRPLLFEWWSDRGVRLPPGSWSRSASVPGGRLDARVIARHGLVHDHRLHGLCAGGGAVLVLQTLLLLFGAVDADVDLDADADGDVSDGSVSLFSLRAIASFFTFFGLTGWYGMAREWSGTQTVLVATAAGFALMVVVAWMMAMQSRLQSKGNLNASNAVGKTARVYLRIPAEEAGFGKIQVKVQNRTVELNAFTKGDELPTGAVVRVTRMTTPDTFEVELAKEEKP